VAKLSRVSGGAYEHQGVDGKGCFQPGGGSPAGCQRGLRALSPASPHGSSRPSAQAALRQAYRVASEIPSSSASSRILLLWGGHIFFSTASLRSEEYCMVSSFRPSQGLLEPHIRGATSILTEGLSASRLSPPRRCKTTSCIRFADQRSTEDFSFMDASCRYHSTTKYVSRIFKG